jgi:hypothetical protein
MSSPSAEPCPEPVPYSTHNVTYMADVDFPTSEPAVFNAQPAFVAVDSILSNQLGPVTNPVSANSAEYNFMPVMPNVSDSNASPVVSSAVGADINAPSTLASSNTSDFLSVNNVESLTQPKMEKPENKKVEKAVESFDNTNLNKMKLSTNNNLASYITNNKPVVKNNVTEHFNMPSSHNVKIIVLVLLLVGAGAVYYMHSNNILPDMQLVTEYLQKVPIVSELMDPNVSDNNKLMIVIGIVVVIYVLVKVL